MKFVSPFAVCLIACLCGGYQLLTASAEMSSKSARFTISTTWNNHSISSKELITIELIYEDDLTIKVSAPFYNDPILPDMTNKTGSMDKLYNYEVVEVFLLGDDDKYLEVELGPRGQYLVLELKGYRNVVRYPIPLKFYRSLITGNHWICTAVVQKDILPPNISHMNAYAIHGSDEKRVYWSLYPAPSNDANYTQPDFHRLELFQPISLFNKH